MRHCIVIFYFVFSFFLNGCTNKYNRIYFTINPEESHIAILVQINDSITANMVFDTGALFGSFILDSSWINKHPSCLPLDIQPDTLIAGVPWLNYGMPSLYYKEFHRTVKIGNSNLEYNRLLTYNWKDYTNTNSDGLFNIPEQDTTHVWELNFENNYLEIHPANRFKMPKDCILLNMEPNEENPYPFNVSIPMHLKSEDGDTLTTNYIYIIDLGMSQDIAFWTDNKMEFFSKKNGAVWTQSPSGYKRHYTVNATLFDNFTIDSLRIYTYNNAYNQHIKHLIGLNFLKRFNVFFDLKNRQIGLQPIKNFQRIMNPNQRRFYYMSPPNQEGKYIISLMADYEENYFKKAGLQEGDEIVSINEISINELTLDQRNEFYEMDTLFYQIIREGKQIKIAVPVDNNHDVGD